MSKPNLPEKIGIDISTKIPDGMPIPLFLLCVAILAIIAALCLGVR